MYYLNILWIQTRNSLLLGQPDRKYNNFNNSLAVYFSAGMNLIMFFIFITHGKIEISKFDENLAFRMTI